MARMRVARPRRLAAVAAVLLCAALLPSIPAAAAPPPQPKGLWQRIGGTPAATHGGHRADVHAKRLATYTLDRPGMKTILGTAPHENARRRAAAAPLVVSLPTPTGGFERFELANSPVMEAGLAARHPEIQTYVGKGLDDPTTTIRADLTPLGFHASVRSSRGSWYIDPYYNQDQTLYGVYYGRDLTDAHG